jgi:hypothetical protein
LKINRAKVFPIATAFSTLNRYQGASEREKRSQIDPKLFDSKPIRSRLQGQGKSANANVNLANATLWNGHITQRCASYSFVQDQEKKQHRNSVGIAVILLWIMSEW